jgi:hypothetical protein
MNTVPYAGGVGGLSMMVNRGSEAIPLPGILEARKCKPKRQGVQVDRKKRRWRNSSRADKTSKLKHDWKLPDD